MDGLTTSNRNVGPELAHPFRYGETKPGSTARDDSDLALEQRRREHRRQITGGGVWMSTGVKIRT
jgi:hypothetical protein